MFRFLHTADLHLDSPLLGLSAREGRAVETILGASRKAFTQLIDLAINEAVAFVVIAGDVYDRDWKGYETGLFFRKGMVRLQQAGIRVYLIAGNHDAASVISRKLSLPENVTVFSSRAPETIEPPEWAVAIHGMSFPNRAVEENLVPRYPDPVPDKLNIGLLHTSLSGAEGHDTYAPCTLPDLVEKGYDYWALGHIHLPQVLREDPWVVYAGNIQGRSVKECGARGCRIVTVGDTGEIVSCAWHELDVARWAVITIDLTGIESLTGAVAYLRSALEAGRHTTGDRLLAARIIFTGSTPLHGMLQSRPDRLEAEVQGCADELGDDGIWIEQVKISTSPMVSLEDLADRDSLTKIVVEAIHTAESAPDLPAEFNEMLAVLPPEMREELATETAGPAKRAALQAACALILNRLTTKGANP